MRIQIRPRRDADLGRCVDLLLAVHRSDGYPVDMPEEPVTFLAMPDLLAAWVAEDQDDGGGDPGGGGEIVGHVALRPTTTAPVIDRITETTGLDADRIAIVARLLVSPAARRHGVGLGLLQAAAQGAVELGRHPALDVVRDHRAAVSLYERAGWRSAGEVRVTFRSGLSVDELVFVAPAECRTGGPTC